MALTLRIAEILGNVDVWVRYGLPIPVRPLETPMAVRDRAVDLAGVGVLTEVELAPTRAAQQMRCEFERLRARAAR